MSVLLRFERAGASYKITQPPNYIECGARDRVPIHDVLPLITQAANQLTLQLIHVADQLTEATGWRGRYIDEPALTVCDTTLNRWRDAHISSVPSLELRGDIVPHRYMPANSASIYREIDTGSYLSRMVSFDTLWFDCTAPWNTETRQHVLQSVQVCCRARLYVGEFLQTFLSNRVNIVKRRDADHPDQSPQWIILPA